MPLLMRFLNGALRRVLIQMSWKPFVVGLIIHYLLFWAVLVRFEEAGSEITDPVNFWYFYWVTIETIGFGDLAPKTPWSRGIFPLFGLSGVIIGMFILGKLVAVTADFFSRYHRGFLPAMENTPVIIIGYRAGVVETILREHTASDPDEKMDFVLVDAVLERLPFDPKEFTGRSVQFIRGAVHTIQTLERAKVSSALTIYVCGRTDPDNVAIVTALSHLHIGTIPIVMLHDEKTVLPVLPNGMRVEVVSPTTPERAVRARHDPDAAKNLAELGSATGGENAYDIRVFAGMQTLPFPEFRRMFEQTFNATILSVNGRIVKPGKMQSVSVSGGDTVSYINDHRIDREWPAFIANLRAA